MAQVIRRAWRRAIAPASGGLCRAITQPYGLDNRGAQASGGGAAGNLPAAGHSRRGNMDEQPWIDDWPMFEEAHSKLPCLADVKGAPHTPREKIQSHASKGR